MTTDKAHKKSRKNIMTSSSLEQHFDDNVLRVINDNNERKCLHNVSQVTNDDKRKQYHEM